VKPNAKPAYEIFRGSDLGGPAFRVVSKCPPSADDFVPYASAGRQFHNKLWFRATGVSMFTTKREAVKVARGGVMGSFVATLDLDDANIYFALTNRRTGHVDVWAPSRLLADLVVNCEEIPARKDA
jgi:hypothetical protein